MAESGAGSPSMGDRRWDFALRNQLNVLTAIFFRDADSRHGRRFALGYLATALEPLIIILMLGALVTTLNRNLPYGQSVYLLMATGVFPIYMFIHTSVRVRQSLGIGRHRVRFPIEKPLDLVFAHGVQHFLMYVVIATLFFVALKLVGVEGAMPLDPLAAILTLGAIFLFGLGVGIINSVVARIVPVWDLVWPAISRAMLHFSGLYYVAASFPPDIRAWLIFNPVLHGTNLFRKAFYYSWPDYASSKSMILGSALIALTFGLLLEASTRQYLESRE
jgi:capsular polysaccharide transport system permease protein